MGNTTFTPPTTTGSSGGQNLVIRFFCISNYSTNGNTRGPDLSWSNPDGILQSDVSLPVESGGIGMVAAEYEVLAGPHLNDVLHQCTANITGWLPGGLDADDDVTPFDYSSTCNIILCRYKHSCPKT